MGRHRLAAVVAALLASVGVASAHAGSLSGGPPVPIPPWLVTLTGGGVVVASFMFTSFVTDRALIARAHRARPVATRDRLARGVVTVGRLVGLLGLLWVVIAGLTGSTRPVENAAILLVWVAWWAGFTMTTYLVGNGWPAIDPFRALARGLARWLPATLVGRVSLDRYTPVISVGGLLALVWLEVVSPVASDPRLLAGVVVGYTAVVVVAAALVGPERWFARVDPVSRVFRLYGAMAPIGRTDAGLSLRVPGAALRDLVADDGDVAFIVGLLWVTTYDGLVTTPVWRVVVTALADGGVPPLLVYLVALLAGYACFLGAYRLAARAVPQSADSYLSTGTAARRFAPALVPIAAGYHLAHFLPYFLELSPALATVLANPLADPVTLDLRLLVLPGWVGGLGLLFVVLGHLLAVWVAHAVAFDLFTGLVQPIRSQYPSIVVMVVYTVTSLWILAQPYGTPPFTG